MSVFISGLHYYGFALAIAAYIMRSQWFKRAGEQSLELALKRIKGIHILLHVALLLSLLTGFYRLFAGTDKAVAFYMKQGIFHGKLGLVFLIIFIELVCVFKAASWAKKGYVQNSKMQAKTFKIMHMISSHLYAIIPFIAAAVSRGMGL
ncbi:MAG TPA: DUF2214 family protein [Oligoflexia bacterium]|nr:DUF2214 family protein [Oligoflexia bacterium]HMR25102.1 DUF2214 family protein [Oligoflexia bacterium]